MWAGSIRGGLIGMKETYLHTYGDVPLNSTGGLSYKTVTGMYEDRDHILWFGTDGDGIKRFDPQTGVFRHYPETFDRKVVSVIDYGEKELLLSVFSQGIYRFDKSSGRLREYTVADSERSRRIFRAGLSVHLSRQDKDRLGIGPGLGSKILAHSNASLYAHVCAIIILPICVLEYGN